MTPPSEEDSDPIDAPSSSILNQFPGMSEAVEADIQILRSVSPWSAGCSTERSIQNAYLRVIAEARHFIYIENQFFISGCEGDQYIRNRVAQAIVCRIQRAHAKGETFRVMIFMPLYPAFPGKPEAKDAFSLRGVMHWQYRTICRGEASMYHKLLQALDDPFEYLAVFGLRTHGQLSTENVVTEEIYIHSKTLIADDRVAIIGLSIFNDSNMQMIQMFIFKYFAYSDILHIQIFRYSDSRIHIFCIFIFVNSTIGSANINERSLAGSRDSEIALVVEDTTFCRKTWNGVEVDVGTFGHHYRMALFQEHFGLESGSNKLEDPVSDAQWFAMQDQAFANAELYAQVFRCVPSDDVQTFQDLHLKEDATTTTQVEAPTQEEESLKKPQLKMNNLKDKVNMRDCHEQLAKVQGHAVYFPLHFLAGEDLEPRLYPAELFQ